MKSENFVITCKECGSTKCEIEIDNIDGEGVVIVCLGCGKNELIEE